MHYVERAPVPALRPWVDKLWALRDAPQHTRERILPNGTLELVINLHEDEFRIYPASDGGPCQRLRGAIVSGAYDRYFGIDTREHASIIGVHFKPAGAGAVLGAPAGLLRNAHVELDAIWGSRARWVRERLCSARDVNARFGIIESELCGRLAPMSQHAAIPLAVAQLERGAPVVSVAARAGLSHRRFIEAFGAAVGMTPKAFARVRRFQRALSQLRGSAAPDWCELAVHAGYFDQSHLIREFGALAGLRPTELLSLGGVPVKEHHIALPGGDG
jgi:AraC-like DNA-binding protein